MATFCRGKGCPSRSSTPRPRSSSPAEVAERGRGRSIRVLAAVVVYGHQPSASTQIMTAVRRGLHGHQGARAGREPKVLLLGGHVAALPERTLREEDADFVAGGEGLHTLVELSSPRSSRADRCAKVPRPVVPRRRPACRTTRRPLVADLDARDAGHRLGPAADGALPRPQLALPRRPRAPALRGPLHDARLPVPLLVLLHPGAVQERRARRPACKSRSTATASGAPSASSSRSTCW